MFLFALLHLLRLSQHTLTHSGDFTANQWNFHVVRHHLDGVNVVNHRAGTLGEPIDARIDALARRDKVTHFLVGLGAAERLLRSLHRVERDGEDVLLEAGQTSVRQTHEDVDDVFVQSGRKEWKGQ